MEHRTAYVCRSCKSTVTDLFGFGEQYVSDFVPFGKHLDGTKVPVELQLCGNCGLVQAKHSLPPEKLYREHYWFKSGSSQTIRDALCDVAYTALTQVAVKEGDVCLDIGSNDGTLLRNYPGYLRTVGIEPASNLREEGSRGIGRLIPEFWGTDAALRAVQEESKPKIVTACGMMYDLEDPNDFIADVAKVLHPGGVFVAQLTCLRQTVLLRDVGNFCHEHLEFYSLESLVSLYLRHGLRIYRVEENDVNVGSYRIFARHAANRQAESSVAKALMAEQEDDLNQPKRLMRFFEELKEQRERCINHVTLANVAGLTVFGLGASTKGNTLLQWYGFGPQDVAAIADGNPDKHGKVTIGTGIPVLPKELCKRFARKMLVLPYGFLPEFLAETADWRQRGGRLLVPLPVCKEIG